MEGLPPKEESAKEKALRLRQELIARKRAEGKSAAEQISTTEEPTLQHPEPMPESKIKELHLSEGQEVTTVDGRKYLISTIGPGDEFGLQELPVENEVVLVYKNQKQLEEMLGTPIMASLRKAETASKSIQDEQVKKLKLKQEQELHEFHERLRTDRKKRVEVLRAAKDAFNRREIEEAKRLLNEALFPLDPEFKGFFDKKNEEEGKVPEDLLELNKEFSRVSFSLEWDIKKLEEEQQKPKAEEKKKDGVYHIANGFEEYENGVLISRTVNGEGTTNFRDGTKREVYPKDGDKEAIMYFEDGKTVESILYRDRRYESYDPSGNVTYEAFSNGEKRDYYPEPGKKIYQSVSPEGINTYYDRAGKVTRKTDPDGKELPINEPVTPPINPTEGRTSGSAVESQKDQKARAEAIAVRREEIAKIEAAFDDDVQEEEELLEKIRKIKEEIRMKSE